MTIIKTRMIMKFSALNITVNEMRNVEKWTNSLDMVKKQKTSKYAEIFWKIQWQKRYNVINFGVTALHLSTKFMAVSKITELLNLEYNFHQPSEKVCSKKFFLLGFKTYWPKTCLWHIPQFHVDTRTHICRTCPNTHSKIVTINNTEIISF